jgi:HSP20 family protein
MMMRRDDRDDPLGDIFDEIERMMGGLSDDGGFGTETHVDVHDLGDEIRLVADLPGVEKGGLELQCDGEVMTIGAAGDRREYNEHIRLPVRVDEHSASATFNNGILTVTLRKVDDSASIDLD